MKIEKLEVEQFGGLRNFTLELTTGVQYIHGVNEAGKSTLCAFMAAMFYGLPAKVRGGGLKGDSRSLYMPWGETYMAGTLHFEHEGTRYVLKRRFGQTARGDRTNLYSALDWQEIVMPPEEIGQHFLGVGEEAFYKTLFISQLGAAFEKGKEDELLMRLSNLEHTGDEDASVQKAITELERVQYELISKTGRGGSLVQLDGEIEALKQELLDAKQKHGTFRSLLLDIRRMTAEKEETEQKLNRLLEQRKAALAFEAYQNDIRAMKEQTELTLRLEKEKEALAKEQQEQNRLSREKESFAYIFSLGQEQIMQIAEQETVCAVLEKQLAEEQALRQEVESLQEAVSQKRETKKKLCVPIITVSAFVATAAMVLGIFVKPLWFGLLVISAMLIPFFYQKDDPKELLALEAKLSEKVAGLSKLAAEETDKKLSGMRAEIALVYVSAEVRNRAALLEKAEAAKALAYQLDGKEKEIARLQENIAIMEKTLAAMPKQEMPEAVIYEGPSVAALDAERENLQSKQLSIERELAQKNAKAENGFLGTRSVGVIETALEEALKRREAMQETYETVSLAKNTMAECFEELKSSFAPILNETSGTVIAELTGGRYQEVRVTDDYKMMLKTPDGNEIVPAEYVSAGTYDLLYFALRMAVLHTLYEKIPLLILDDTFIQLDDERQKAGFSWLCRNHSEQVLYFSCHKPPAEWEEAVITLTNN